MNIDRIIFLNWLDIQIGRLLYIDNQYVFQIIENNIGKAKEKFCPIEMIPYYKGSNSFVILQELPLIFREFKISVERVDCYRKLGILKDDDEYTKLYKLATKSNDVDKNGFWISTYFI